MATNAETPSNQGLHESRLAHRYAEAGLTNPATLIDCREEARSVLKQWKRSHTDQTPPNSRDEDRLTGSILAARALALARGVAETLWPDAATAKEAEDAKEGADTTAEAQVA